MTSEELAIGYIAAQTRKRYRERLRKKRIRVPKWVPKRLVVEFADCALAYGEERAASYVRKLKREAGL